MKSLTLPLPCRSFIAARCIALLLSCCAGGLVQAHNPDTSYARIEIGADKIRLKLTYDLYTLNKISPLDDNGDGRISEPELLTHLNQIGEFLSRFVSFEVAGAPPGIGALSSHVWPRGAEDGVSEKDFHSAAFLISLIFERPVEDTPEDITVRFNFFDRLGDRHSVLGNFCYEGKDHEVTFNQFEPDYLFDTGYEPPLAKRLLKFFCLGVEHILLGFDHLCFLLALLLVARFSDMVKIITSFTIAHSITLALAVMNVVRLPARWVECAVALSIVYVALENLTSRRRSNRWLLTFGFGLVHGFAFASALDALSLPAAGLFRCLMSFNLGVEAGQIALVSVLLPLILLLQRWRHERIFVAAASSCIACAGLIWFATRLL